MQAQIVFDFVQNETELGESEREALERITALVEKYSEPWLCRFGPEELQTILTGIGFSQTTHFSDADAMKRYFGQRTDGLHLDISTQMMSAIV